MRIEYLAAIAIVVFAAGTGLAVHSVGSLPPEKQSTPTAAQLATRVSSSPWIRSCLGPVANGRRNSKRIGGAAQVMRASRPFGRAIGSVEFAAQARARRSLAPRLARNAVTPLLHPHIRVPVGLNARIALLLLRATSRPVLPILAHRDRPSVARPFPKLMVDRT